jgi:hypothetical protein
MSLLWTSADKSYMTQSEQEAIAGFYDAEQSQDLFLSAGWLRHLEFLKDLQRLNSPSLRISSGYEGGERRRG